jgi:hypothetical protein
VAVRGDNGEPGEVCPVGRSDVLVRLVHVTPLVYRVYQGRYRGSQEILQWLDLVLFGGRLCPSF